MVKSMAIASYRDESIRREGGLQARGAYKEVPRASRRLAWAALRVLTVGVNLNKGQKIPYILLLLLFLVYYYFGYY
jgi:hypothetical protein